MTVWRPTFRAPWPAMATATLIVLVVAVLLSVVWWRMESVKPSVACLDGWLFSGEWTAACEARVAPWQGAREPERVWLGLIRIVPIIAGLMFGSMVGAAARSWEFAIEGGWKGWLTRRLIPATGLLLLALIALAVAATLYEAARMPGLDPLASYNEYGVAGGSVVVRGLAAFGVTVLAWVLVRRRVIAIIVSAVLAWLVLWGTTEAFPYGAPTEWLLEEDAAYAWLEGDIGLETAWRDASGTIIPFLAAKDLAPDAGWLDWAEMHFWDVEAVLRSERFLEVQLREALMLGGVAALSLGGAILVMARRTRHHSAAVDETGSSSTRPTT